MKFNDRTKEPIAGGGPVTENREPCQECDVSEAQASESQDLEITEAVREGTTAAAQAREDMWRGALAGCGPMCTKPRRLFRMIPALQRCKNCHAPFSGGGALLMRIIGRGRYTKNPLFCNY
jgi:hypothetical protein